MKMAPNTKNNIITSKEKNHNEIRQHLYFFNDEQHPHNDINQAIIAKIRPKETTKKLTGIGNPFSS